MRAACRVILAACVLALAASCADKPTVIAEPRLFGAVAEPLTAQDTAGIEALFAELVPRSADGARFEDPTCGDVEPAAELADLNGDGAPEVFVQWGNACTSGGTGRSLSLFVKNGAGAWQAELGFPAFGHRALASQHNGFRDLELGGPGFCFEVWTREAESYEFSCNLPQEEGGCDGLDNVCPAR